MLLNRKGAGLMGLPHPQDKGTSTEILRAGCVLLPSVLSFTLATPLMDLTKNSQLRKVQWSEDCEAIFQALREPVLSQPDFPKPFILQTDTSEAGRGAVLSQELEGEEHPILYLSHKLLPRETHYSTVEQEALAVKCAVDTLRYYLLENPFLLVTDHAPLRRIHSMKETNV